MEDSGKWKMENGKWKMKREGRDREKMRKREGRDGVENGKLKMENCE